MVGIYMICEAKQALAHRPRPRPHLYRTHTSRPSHDFIKK